MTLTNFTVRLMSEQDADQLVALVRKCYGDGYPNKILYRPEEIAAAIRDGLMHSIVSVDPNDRMIGHCALTFSAVGAPVPEAGKMVVDPDCRGQHLSNRLAEHRKTVAVENDLVGYWSECVTNHPFSQHEIIDSGGVETGAFIAKDSPTWHMAGVNNVTDVRLSLMTYFIPIKDAPQRTLYLPPSYAEFARALAADLKLSRTIMTTPEGGDGAAEALETMLVYTVNPGNQFAQLTISSIGQDVGARVSGVVSLLQGSGIEVFHLDLPLEQPNAIQAIGALEALGFFWAAWLPEYSESGDVLRLQKTEAAVNPDEIICARENGERVKAHILAERQRVMKL